MVRSLRVAILVYVSLVGVACSSKQAAQSPGLEATLQAIPAADSAQYEHIQDMKKWRNPYLIVRTDGVTLYDASDNAEILLKTDEVLAALAKLPPANWPYGRVVAAAESSDRKTKQDAVAIRRNKGIVGGMLEGAHVAVKWVPLG
jgi:hypothetical protein